MKPSVYKLGRFFMRAVTDKKQAADAWPVSFAFEDTAIKTARRPSWIFSNISADYVLAVDSTVDVSCDPSAWRRLLAVARDSSAGMIYSDYIDKNNGRFADHPLTDYQPGSLRNDFNFGHLFIFSAAAVKTALQKYGALPSDPDLALYDLRLKISINHSLFHVPEFLYTVQPKKQISAAKTAVKIEAQFAYVAKENAVRQKKFERIATNYLKLIAAHLPPRIKTTDREPENSQWKASIVIPVLDRRQTIADALESALAQETDFPFNILAVDNHSTDGTTGILKKAAAAYPHVHHLIPKRRGLGIGGCWNEAVFSPLCGRYAVQLDSDDLYSSPQTLQKIVNTLRKGRYAMVVGSYTLVNEKLSPIKPGLIDHREWTPQNGHNNLLRVGGMGAPRAFDTAVVRGIGFPDVSYGEDYAVALRLSREYKIGRIYESLYWCRRWRDNTDAGLSVEKQNRHDYYKDKLRTIELQARQQLNERERSIQDTGLRKNVKNQNEHRHSRAGGNPELLNTGFTLRGTSRVALRLPGMTNKEVTIQPHKPDWQAVSGPSPATGYIFAEFPGEGGVTLPVLCNSFFEAQKKSWPQLASACRNLALAKTRELACGNYSITLQYNPARAVSSGAALDKESIRKRPCFLCAANRPAEQHALLYRDEYLILCNPAPIFDHHFTVASLAHRPQEITSSLSALLQIAQDASPEYAVLYNGPSAGASAPDHLHFQMIPLTTLPFLTQFCKLPPVKNGSSVRSSVETGFDRAIVVMESENADVLKRHFFHLLNATQENIPVNEEPLVNVFCTYKKAAWRLIAFLRGKHRPDAYFAKGNKRIFVSPGAIDMAGVIITPRLLDFENLDGDAVRNIYREISLDEETIDKITMEFNQCPRKK